MDLFGHINTEPVLTAIVFQGTSLPNFGVDLDSPWGETTTGFCAGFGMCEALGSNLSIKQTNKKPTLISLSTQKQTMKVNPFPCIQDLSINNAHSPVLQYTYTTPEV